MSNNKKNAKFTGLMFLFAMATSLSGGILIQGIIDKPDFLSDILNEKMTIIIAVILELINAFTVIFIAAAFWISYKKQEIVRVAYLAIRIIEASVCALSAFIPITLLSIARRNNNISMAADILRTIRGDLVSYAIPIFFGIGAIFFYFMLYKSQLIPKYITVWGLIASVLVMTNMFVSAVSLKAALAFPIITNEIYLGIYLLTKGYKTETPTDLQKNEI